MNNDYIMLFDESGSPYLSHILSTVKYIQRIMNYYGPGEHRYFYSIDEWNAYKKAKEKVNDIKDEVNRQREAEKEREKNTPKTEHGVYVLSDEQKAEADNGKITQAIDTYHKAKDAANDPGQALTNAAVESGAYGPAFWAMYATSIIANEASTTLEDIRNNK